MSKISVITAENMDNMHVTVRNHMIMLVLLKKVSETRNSRI